MIKVPLVQEHRPAESAAEERLWDALQVARAGSALTVESDLELALFRVHWPTARTIAQATVAESALDRTAAEDAAGQALAQAVRDWRYRTGQGFRSYAQLVVLQRLHGVLQQPA